MILETFHNSTIRLCAHLIHASFYFSLNSECLHVDVSILIGNMALVSYTIVNGVFLVVKYEIMRYGHSILLRYLAYSPLDSSNFSFILPNTTLYGELARPFA